MKFRSTKRSGAALASTALVASALSVPMLFAAPAQAAPTTTVEDASFSCVYGDFTLDWVTDIDFDATWATAGGRAQITATLKDDMMAGGPSASSASTLTVSRTTPAGTKTGTMTGTNPNGKVGPTVKAPQVTGTPLAISGESVTFNVTKLDVAFGTNGAFGTMACTPKAAITVTDLAVSLPEAAAGTAQLLCETLGTTFYYPATVSTTATRAKGATSTSVSVALGEMPGLTPFILPDVQVTSNLDLAVGETPFEAIGTSGTADLPGGAAVPIPVARGTVASVASPFDVRLVDADFVATSEGDVEGATHIACDLKGTFTASGVAVTLTDSAACISAKGKVAPATAAVKNANAKIAPDNAAVTKAKAAVTKAQKAVKKAKGKKKTAAKKKLKAAQKALAAANAKLAGDKNAAGKAASALAAANNAVKANC